MLVSNHFNDFLRIISLNPTRGKRIESALSNFKSLCENDGPIQNAFEDSFLHGSFAHKTVIRPVDDSAEYDVDLTLVLDFSKLNIDDKSPASVLQWLTIRVRNHFQNLPFLQTAPRVEQRNRCVRIEYVGDFHLDIVPACHGRNLFRGVDRSCLYIPDRKAGRWIKSNPRGFNEWFLEIDKANKFRVRKVIQLFKHWRDAKFSLASAPKSILLETLVGKNFAGKETSIDVVFYKNLLNLKKWFSNRFILFGIYVGNPSLGTENIAASWAYEDMKLFRERLENAIKWAGNALNAQRESSTVNYWQRVFGDLFM